MPNFLLGNFMRGFLPFTCCFVFANKPPTGRLYCFDNGGDEVPLCSFFMCPFIPWSVELKHNSKSSVPNGLEGDFASAAHNIVWMQDWHLYPAFSLCCFLAIHLCQVV